MKKIKYISIISYILTFFILCACSKTKNSIEAITTEDCVAYELSQIEEVNNYSDEQLKALSVVIRTKLINNPNNINKNIDKNIIENKYLNLTKETKKQVLVDDKKLANVDYATSINKGTWKENIKKSSILNFMIKKGINLSNITNIETETNSDGTLSALKVGGKKIEYDELKNNFNIKSNNITDVKNNFSSIEISGQYSEDKNCLYLNKLKEYTDENYRQLLKHYYTNYDLKTI